MEEILIKNGIKIILRNQDGKATREYIFEIEKNKKEEKKREKKDILLKQRGRDFSQPLPTVRGTVV